MTNEEALYFLEQNKIFDKEHLIDFEALKAAKQALEKQIPKKPIEHSHFRTLKMCPLCRSGVNGSNYCAYCGQRINWEA